MSASKRKQSEESTPVMEAVETCGLCGHKEGGKAPMLKLKDPDVKQRDGEPICLFFTSTDSSDDHTQYYRLPLRCIGEEQMKRLEEWRKHADYPARDTSVDDDLVQRPVKRAKEREEIFTERVHEYENKELFESVLATARLGQEIEEENFVGLRGVRMVVTARTIY